MFRLWEAQHSRIHTLQIDVVGSLPHNVCSRIVHGRQLPEQIEQLAVSVGEAILPQVGRQVQPGQRILIVRGGDAEGRPSGREWLADQLRAAGAEVDEVAAYRRAPPAAEGLWTARAAAGAQDRSVWLFSSSEAVANLCQCMPQQRWQQARALATHPRIAEAARSAGFGSVTMVRPMLDAVAASIKSLHDT